MEDQWETKQNQYSSHDDYSNDQEADVNIEISDQKELVESESEQLEE